MGILSDTYAPAPRHAATGSGMHLEISETTFSSNSSSYSKRGRNKAVGKGSRFGANPRKAILARFANFLQLPAYYGKQDLVHFLLGGWDNRVSVNDYEFVSSKCHESFSGEIYGTALQVTSARSHDEIAE